ncbi:hypothetical protein M5D96_013014 [Drosophila gunungcola]|uniref:Uncharacterized protein n=1 Tax=Drosophila gunungcola TaxID=103775 RepID=A0A9P9YCS7_9MUSC|nr:hypothetical protein M5D96_013014 [Drosophila gunungcola]
MDMHIYWERHLPPAICHPTEHHPIRPIRPNQPPSPTRHPSGPHSRDADPIEPSVNCSFFCLAERTTLEEPKEVHKRNA